MNDKKISLNRQKKEKIVAELIDKASRAKGMVFTNYQGLTHVQLEKLKKAIKPLNAEMAVTKNTLLKLALKIQNSKFKIQNSFEDPTATLFLYGEPVSPLKEIAKAIKEFNLPKIKFGILEGKILSEDEVIKISALPSREILLAQLVGGLKSPIYSLHRTLNWNIQSFVMTLKAIEGKKSQLTD
ncbi:MAG: 50S ribosomal protein L10 [Patescibacteria group bacterium]